MSNGVLVADWIKRIADDDRKRDAVRDRENEIAARKGAPSSCEPDVLTSWALRALTHVEGHRLPLAKVVERPARTPTGGKIFVPLPPMNPKPCR